MKTLNSGIFYFVLAAFSVLEGVFPAPVLAATTEGLPHVRYYGDIELVHTFNGPMPTGVTVSRSGRIFVNFPQWGDEPNYAVVELTDGKLVPYPDMATNTFEIEKPHSGFISVQSVIADGQNHLWVLDTAAPGFQPPIQGGAKLVEIDLATNKVIANHVFPPDVIFPTTYVNDMRFDFRVGKAGVVYVTDSSLSGPGAIIVMDLATGKALRRLSGDSSTAPDPNFIPVVEGVNMVSREADGKISPFRVASDGIALSPDGVTLYFSALSSRRLYAVPTALLRDPNISEEQLSRAVMDIGEKGASDGLEADANGAIYASDYEHNGIRKRLPDGQWQTLVHDPRVLWPDTLSIGTDGYLYFIVNQLHRQPVFHGGNDLRDRPYSLFRIEIDALPAPTR